MRGSVEGFTAKYFHYTCDGKGPTLTLVQSEHELVFGGFTNVPWTRNIAYYSDEQAFIMSLSRGTLHRQKRNKGCAVRHHANCLPTFGGGFGFASDNDILICDGANSVKESFCNLGETYELPPSGLG
jgi:hypothetical protein